MGQTIPINWCRMSSINSSTYKFNQTTKPVIYEVSRDIPEDTFELPWWALHQPTTHTKKIGTTTVPRRRCLICCISLLPLNLMFFFYFFVVILFWWFNLQVWLACFFIAIGWCPSSNNPSDFFSRKQPSTCANVNLHPPQKNQSLGWCLPPENQKIRIFFNTNKYGWWMFMDVQHFFPP